MFSSSVLLVDPLLAVGVVLLPLLVVREDGVGLRDLLELLLGLGRLVPVRVELEGQPPVGGLDVVLVGVLLDSQDVVEVPRRRAAHRTASLSWLLFIFIDDLVVGVGHGPLSRLAPSSRGSGSSGGRPRRAASSRGGLGLLLVDGGPHFLEDLPQGLGLGLHVVRVLRLDAFLSSAAAAVIFTSDSLLILPARSFFVFSAV